MNKQFASPSVLPLFAMLFANIKADCSFICIRLLGLDLASKATLAKLIGD